ncbi:MAG: diaminopimelate decarboxylase [Bdellovibrionales bacterium]|nr:diaminopimelate decarboxylase [Bdellovibrionales bacterium]
MKKTFQLPKATDSFFYKKDRLTVDGVLLDELLERFGSPLYVYSGTSIRKSYQAITSSMKGLPLQICYAVKANSNLQILRLLSSLGAGCDLVSYGEWSRAELARVPRERRVLSGVAKTAKELESLFKLENAGVFSVHVESAMEFELIVLMANAMRRKLRVAFRYNPDVDARTLDKISTGRKKDKFGLTREEILDLAITYGDDDFVRIEGLSIHIGSQITSLKPYDHAFSRLAELKEELEAHLGRSLSYLDLGGGIGVQYRDERPISLPDYAALVKKHFKKVPKILLEPGRSLLASAGALLSEVVYSKERGRNRTLILDAGMNDLVRPALYGAYHEIAPLILGQTDAVQWDVVGGICESSDYFAKNRKLAIEGLPGERLAILSSGAYGFSMSSTYNSRPRIAEVLVDQGKVKLIRKRETIKDLVRHEV